ncbi:alcohol oxidase [Obba rivulosa]|uniref:Alcohol oxidase n=1 Tax=Obba rivulosa TaxID=1052685 RepID=A0A8E2ATU1_9APHY|nr:alcohol oxidase [Obba rivulosa]
MSQTDATYDIVIAGGGTAGCIIAGRLAAADPSLKILVLEAGPPTLDDVLHTQPARYLYHLRPDSTTVKFNVAKPSPHVAGRSIVVPCGQCLGGGSSVNFTMYTRAAASDYQDWETVHGNKGWGFNDLLPLLRKCETYQVAPGKETHGYEGPLKVSYGGLYSNIGKDFLDIAAQYDKTRGRTDDPNSLLEINAYGRWQKWIDAKTGKRSDTAHHYVYNQSHQRNLHVKTGYLVKRVIFENNRAVGVEYIPNVRFQPDASLEPLIARASKLVVLSAGTFGSPAILERSGIGAAAVLEQAGVAQRVDLPGVGENYQDHQVIFAPFCASEESATLDGIVRSEPEEVEKWSAQWAQDGQGLMASNALDAGVKIRPSPEELKAVGPDFAPRWQEYFADAPDKPIMWLGPISVFTGDPSIAPARKYFGIGYFVEYPASIGHVHITSGEDVNAPADFDPAYLTGTGDLAIMNYGYKRAREFARRMPAYRGEFTPMHPAFPEGSTVVCKMGAMPVAVDAPDLEYTPEEERAIEEYTRQFVGTAWHSLGTCAMKSRDKGGVVDPKLNVYGVEGLKVADLSVAPSNVSANTYSTAVLIGEKAAVTIAEELGLTGI